MSRHPKTRMLDLLTAGDQDRIRTDLRLAVAGGSIATLSMAAVLVGVGLANGGSAQPLVAAALPSSRFLASAVMTVSATTLALMLTLLGLSTDIDADVKGGHFERIRQIALVDVAAFVLATALLVVIVVPVDESTPIPEAWFSAIYYAVSVVAALLGGGLIAVMLLLYAAVRDLILVLGPGDQNPLVDDAAEEDEDGADEDGADEDETAAEQLAEAA